MNGRRVVGVALAAVLASSVSGAPQTVRADEGQAAEEALRELQAELDALFAPAPLDVPDETAGVAIGLGQVATPMLAAGPFDTPVVVGSITIVENDAQIILGWDDVGGFGEFEVVLDGNPEAVVDGSVGYTDTVPTGATYDYEIRAVDPDSGPTTVGTVSVAVPSASRGCDFSWTGAVDDDYATPENWAPIDGATGAPQSGDHACIDVRTNTPATSSAADAGAGTITTQLAEDADLPALLEVAAGEFTVTERFGQVDLDVTGGQFASTAITEFRLLTVTGGRLAVAGSVDAPFGVQFGPGSPVVASADGNPVEFDVSPSGSVVTTGAGLDDAALTLEGAVQLGTFGDRIAMNGTSSIVPAESGATIGASFLTVESGTAQVDVSMSSSIVVQNGAALTVTDHQALANGTPVPQLDLDGTLTLTQPVSSLGDVDLRSAASQLVVNGGVPNDLDGVTEIGTMSMFGALDVRVPNDVTVFSLSMDGGGSFTVNGELDYFSSLALSDSTITAPSVVTSGGNPWDGDIDVFGTSNRIVGDVTTDGTIRLNSDDETNADAKLAIDGSLTLAPESRIESTVTGSDVTGRLVVRDEVALDGTTNVRVDGSIPADTDIPAVTWGSVTGAATLELSGSTADTTIEQKPGGIFVRRDGGGPGFDVTAVVATGALLDVELGAQVAVAWPAVLDTDRYAISVDGEPIDETSGTDYVVEDVEPGVELTISVVAIGVEEDETNLGTLNLLVPDGDCTIAWTGAIDSAWDDPLNWLPISDEELPSPRRPGSGDDVCIDVATNTPIAVDGDVSVASVASALTENASEGDQIIDVASGDMIVTGTIDVIGMTIREGSLSTSTLVTEAFRLGNAVVDATTSTIGSLDVSPLAVEVNDAELFGAATIGQVTTASGTSLAIDDLRSPADTVLDLFGALTLGKRVDSLDALFLFEDGSLTIEDDGLNELTGITSLGTLGVQSSGTVDIPENLTIGELLVAGSDLEAAGDVTITGQWTLQDGAFVELAGELELGPDATLAVNAASAAGFPEVDVLGGATLDGALTVDLVEPTTAIDFVSWASSTGAFDSESLTGVGASERELVVDATGISLELPGPSVLSVLGFDVGDGAGDTSLLLSWPAFPGVSTYQVRRNDAVVTATPGASIEVSSPGRSSETWSIVALDDDLRELGVVGSLPVFAPSIGCDVAWTGAVSDSWHDRLNWAPVVEGGAVPLQAVPGETDSVCILSDQNLPVQVTSDVGVGGIVAGLPDDGGDPTPGVEVITVTGADFSSATGGLVSGLSMTGGRLDVDGQFIVEGDLELVSSTLDLGAALVVRDDLNVGGAANELIIDALDAITVELGRLVVDGARLTLGDGARVETNLVTLDDGVLDGAGVLVVRSVVAAAGVSSLDVPGLDAFELVVDEGARLDVVAPAELVGVELDVSGHLGVPAGVDELGVLALGGSVSVGGGSDNDLTGVGRIDALVLRGVDVSFDGGVEVEALRLFGASLLAGGVVSTPDLLADGVSSVVAPSLVVTRGVSSNEVLVVDGDLDASSATTILVTIGGLVDVTGSASLGGELLFATDDPVPPGFTTTLMRWRDSSGSIVPKPSPFSPFAADARVEITPTEAVLTSVVPAVDQLVAYGVTREGNPDLDPSRISLTWPAVDGAESYEVFRGDELVTTTTGTSVKVDDPGDEVVQLRVVAVAGAAPLDEVGSIEVYAAFDECDIVWTGAVDSDWNNRLNWVPVVSIGEALPPMRSPSSVDRTCVTVERGLPITVDADTSIRSIDSTVGGDLDAEAEILAVNAARLTISESSQLGAMTLRGAVVDGAGVLVVRSVVAAAGVSSLDVPGLDAFELVVDEGARLDVVAPVELVGVELDVSGHLGVPAGVVELGVVALGGSVSVGGGADNDLTGVGRFDALVLRGVDVSFDGGVEVEALRLFGGSLSAGGVVSTPDLLADGVSSVVAPSLVVTRGVSSNEVLVVDGDLDVSDASVVQVRWSGLDDPALDVRGAAVLGGEVMVTPETPRPDVGQQLIRWSSATGQFASVVFSPFSDPAGAQLRTEVDGVFVDPSAVDECGDAPQFAGMDVEGCWVDNGDDSHTATGGDNADGVAIGGVDIDFPADDTSITIDDGNGVISTEDASGDPAPVEVSVPVSDDKGESELARISLGSITFEGLQIGDVITFPLGDLFGIPTLGSPKLSFGPGGWGLDLDLSFAGLLRAVGRLDLSIGQAGILSTDLSFDDLVAVFGDLARIGDLDIDWRDASTWGFVGGGLGGPSVTGDVDFSEVDGGGTLSVRDLRVDDVLVSPDFDLTGVFTDTTRTWTASQPPASVLRSVGFTYTTDGDLVAASIQLGDEDGVAVRDSVATWGEWLDVDAFDLTWDGTTSRWDVAGRLTEPQVDITGFYVGDGNGGTEQFQLGIDGAELGPFASFDLDLVYLDDADGERFAVSANIARDGAPDIDGQGVFTFEQGDLATATITFDEIVIGELLTIEDFRITWNNRQGRFAVDGQLLAPDGASNEVSGSLTFDDGRLLEGDLQLDSLTIGPIRFDEFVFEFARTPADAEQRITTASISGEVRAGTREPTPVTGSIEFVDGDITNLELVVGLVDLGGLAQIEDLTLSYTTDDAAGTATMQGGGQLVTSDGATDTPVLVELTLRDGRIVDGRIEADVLRFGRLLTIENFELINSPVTPGTCTDLPAPDGAQQWQVQGETTSNGQSTSIDGCLVIDGRRVVAGELELGNVRLGSLLTIQNLEASFAQQRDLDVTSDDGRQLTINQTDMSLSATVVVGGNDPASFSGSASFANGGLTAFELSLPDLDLMNVVRLRDVEFAYVGDTPWDERDESSYRLRGSVAGENRTTSFDGEVAFGTDGEVTSLSIDAEEVDFGLFRIDVLSFAYSRDGDESRWAISGSVEVDGETTTISGSAIFEDGRIIEASLDIENLVIADLVVIDGVTLDYLRDSDGSEAWLGSGSFTSGGKSNEVSLGFAFDDDGRLVFGSVEIARLKWSELLVFENVSLTYEEDGDQRRWDVAGSIDLDGEVTGLAGFLQLEAGRVTAGELVITNLRIGELTTLRSLALAADTDGPVTTWEAAIVFDNDKNTTGQGSLTWTDGRLTAAQLDLTDVGFGPAFTLEEASLSFTAEKWELSATLENGGDSNSISFELGFDDGRLVSAEFSLTQLKFGDVLAIDDFTISYEKTTDGASWRGSATVTVGERTTSVGASFDFVGGRLVFAEITIGQLAWSEAIVMDDVVLTFDRVTGPTRWTLTGGIIIEGERTSLSGFLELVDGRITAGDLTISNLRVGPLAVVDELSLVYETSPIGSRFDANITLASGESVSGFMEWVDGRLDRAALDLGTIDLGPTFSLIDAVMNYDDGTWTAEATVDNAGSGGTIRGVLVFDEGRLVDGNLTINSLRIAGFSLSDFALVLGDSVDLGGGPEVISGICDTPDPASPDDPGDVYGIKAGFVNESGTVGTVAGRLRNVDGRITDGVLCASDISIGEVLVIDDFLLRPTTQVADDQVRETWTGSIQLSNPTSPNDPFDGSITWVSLNGETQSIEIDASELRFSSLLTLQDVLFAYERTPGGSRWTIGADLQRPDSNPGVTGFLELNDGGLASAEISITDVSFGNVVSLRDFTMTYVGRRAQSTEPSQLDAFSPLPAGSCDATPAGANVPSGPATTTGPESYFRLSAAVGVGENTFAAAGSIGMVDGRVSLFDVSISCLEFGDWLSLEDVRIGRSDDGDYLFVAGEPGDDATTTGVSGNIEMNDDGRVAGGTLLVSNLSLGFVELRGLNLTLGQQPDGTSEWGASVQVNDPDGGTSFAFGGSIQLDDRKVVGGSLEMPRLPLLDLLPIRNFSLGFERLGNGALRLSGGATLIGPNGADAGSIDLRLVWVDGELTAGSLQAPSIKLFGVVDGASLSITYERNAPGGPRWSGSLNARVPGQSASKIAMGIEVVNGKVDSGIIGFDGDGDGEVDPPAPDGSPPLEGNATLGDFPLKALHVRYCSVDSDATFCNGVDGPEWDGRLIIELPTSGAPGLDAAFTVRDGRFVRASIDLSFDPGIMVFAGVFLDSIGGALELDPDLRLCGSLGATVGSPAIAVGRIEGSFQFSEEYSSLFVVRPDPPVGCDETPAPFTPPAGLDPDYYRFLLQADMTLFPGNAVGIDIGGTGYLDFWTTGYLELGAEFAATFWGNKLAVNGAVSGSVIGTNVQATNPRTGQPLTGAATQLYGEVSGTVLGTQVGSIGLLLNTVGWSGCAQLGSGRFSVSLGASGYWNGGFQVGCGMGRVAIFVPGSTNPLSSALTADLDSPFRSSAVIGVTPTADTVFEVVGGEAALGVLMRSATGTPNTLVISPTGQVYDVSAEFGDGGPLTLTDGNEQIFVIEDPVAGTWTVRQVAGSPVLEAVETYLALPEVDVSADLTQRGDQLSFDYSVLEVEGQTVTFVERNTDGVGINVVGRVESDRPSASAGLRRSDDPNSTVRLDTLEASGTATGTVSYRSNAAFAGGEHQLVALVDQDGLPRAEVVLATYQIDPATRSAAPTAVTATATDDGASVTWVPPTDDGGRRITAYHVSSQRGFTVSVDGDARSVELPIPSMTPGETLEIYVQAFTAAGPGDTGVATFVATTTSGPMYDQAVQPESFVVGSDPFTPVADTPVFGPGAVPTPVAPVDPGPPVTPVDPPVVSPPPAAPIPPTPTGALPATGGSAWSPLQLAMLLVLAGSMARFVARQRTRAVPR